MLVILQCVRTSVVAFVLAEVEFKLANYVMHMHSSSWLVWVWHVRVLSKWLSRASCLQLDEEVAYKVVCLAATLAWKKPFLCLCSSWLLEGTVHYNTIQCHLGERERERETKQTTMIEEYCNM